jgi:uncharacterized protein (TIGR03437 family)
MPTMQKLFLALVVTAATLTAQNPSITGVVNAASGIPAGFPNYGIAQGSIFLVSGSNLGPSAMQAASPPLPTTAGLGGTSITITVNGTTVTAPLYSTVSTQVAAVLPSNTPAGTGTLTLTYNSNKGSSPIRVMPTNFGIFNTLVPFADNGVGVLNIAAVTFANYQTSVSATNTAAPGDTLTLWGTGLGATPNNGGDTGAAPFGNNGGGPPIFGGSNIGSAPLVFVGGIQSPSVTYWGRAPNTIPGLDQIEFVVPQNAPLGCNVSIVVQTATPVVVSNGPVIALAATDGATCSDPTQRIPSSLINSTSSAKVMLLGLKQNVSVSPNSNGTTTTTTDVQAMAYFFQVTPAQLAASGGSLTATNAAPSFGSCYTGFSNSQGQGPFPGTFVNAGASLTLTPPSGQALTLTSQSLGVYASASSSTAPPSGTWSFSNGAGGSDVGPLSFTFPVPQQVTWSQAAVYSSPIDRTQPFTITWSGGDSNGYVDIQGYAGVGTYNVSFECAAPTSAGQFTIPSSIMLAMPTGQGQVQVNTFPLTVNLGAVPGLDVALDFSEYHTSVPVMFK